jgi:phospholipase C
VTCESRRYRARMRIRPLALLLLAAACGPSAIQDAGSSDDLTSPKIQHLVILLQENHTFDNYFGLYCASPTGQPIAAGCSGRNCCERAPQNVPGVSDTLGLSETCHAYTSHSWLDDDYNDSHDPNHDANKEYSEMHLRGGAFRMDRYECGNIEYARFDPSAAQTIYPQVAASDDGYPLRTYHSLALSGALADRYFQPIVGASSSNDMFLARASFVFQDNQRDLSFSGYTDPTIGDLLSAHGVSWAVYMGGLNAGCAWDQFYPYCVDLTDNPFEYSSDYGNDPSRLRDLGSFASDLAGGTLPQVSLLRALGAQSEHPEEIIGGGRITDGENRFIKPALDALNASPYAANTLVLIGWDEGGGWYDHVPPPLTLADGCDLPTTPVWANGATPAGKGNCGLIDASHSNGLTLPRDPAAPEYYSNPSYMNGQEYYGTRLPLIALGPYARKGSVSHAVMEHSSIVKFIEWNWLGRKSGQLGARDAHVNNIGSLLDPKLGVPAGVADQ